MPIQLYGHPFASFVWKPLIAAYERGVPFEFRMVDTDHPENSTRIAKLSPTGQFLALTDGSVEITQSNAIIEYLDRFGDAPRKIPHEADAAPRARLLAHRSVARVVDEARPYRAFFPLGAPDRD